MGNREQKVEPECKKWYCHRILIPVDTKCEALSRPLALRKILSGNANEIITAFLSLSYHDTEPQWTVRKLILYSNHKEPAVRSMVLHCLFLMSHLRGALKLPDTLYIALANLEDASIETRHAADELLEEIIQAHCPHEPFTLDRIYRQLKMGTDLLVKLVAAEQLFRPENGRAKVKQLCRKLWPSLDSLLRARLLAEVPPFLIQEDSTLDENFLEEMLDLASQKPSPYVKEKVRELKEWKRHFQG